MKTKHLFIFFILLALTSSGILLTEVSSIAQDMQNVSRTPEKTMKPKATEKNTLSITPGATTDVKGASKTDGDDGLLLFLIISGLIVLLHLLEIVGLVWAYFKIQQLIEKSRDSKNQIKILTDRLSDSEQKQRVQADRLKTISSEAANARNLTSRINAIEQANQQKNSNTSYADFSYNLPFPASAKTAVNSSQNEVETIESIDNSSYLIPKFQGIDVGISLSHYPFLDTYRQNPDNFKNQYTPHVVSEDADNLQKRWSGDTQEIILGEDRQGNYWLFKDGNITYLIPSPKLKVNDVNIRTAGSLFDCNNYTPGYQCMSIVHPAIAIISSQLGADERWKLEKKGALEFT